jgi:hypothetical protein
LIHCCSNIKGLILFKKVAWQTFGGKSSLKNTHGSEDQMCLDLSGSGIVDTITDENCYFVKDIAKYVYNKYKDLETVSLDTVYFDLDRHPIFPSDGFKNELKEELKLTYSTTFPRGKNSVEFKK